MSSPYVGRSGPPGSAEFGATTVSGTAVGAPNGAQADSIATGRAPAPGAVGGPQGPAAPAVAAAPSGPAGAAARGGRPRGPRRAQLQLRHINPWTALKFSCVLGVALFFVWLIVIAILAVLYFIPVVKILQKAGYSGWWCLIVFVPLLNIIMLYVFAFADWPALRSQNPT